MELLVGGFWFQSVSSPCSVLRLVCPPPCTIVCACLRQSQAQNSFKFNSNVTFCVIFSLAFLFSFCFGIFGAFDGAGRQERERDREGVGGLKNTVTERLNRFGFEGGFELEFVLPLQSSFVCSLFLLRLFVMLLLLLFVLLLLLLFLCALLSSIVIQKMAALFVLTFFRISLSLFLGLSFCSDSKRDSCECFLCCCSYCHLYWWGVFYFMLLGVCVTPVHIRPKLPSPVGLACLWLLSDCWQFS